MSAMAGTVLFWSQIQPFLFQCNRQDTFDDNHMHTSDYFTFNWTIELFDFGYAGRQC